MSVYKIIYCSFYLLIFHYTQFIKMKLPNITDAQYLKHFLRYKKLHIEDYKSFCECLSTEIIQFINNIRQKYHIDIVPYLFTIHNINNIEFLRFCRFLKHYLNSVDISICYMNDYLNMKETLNDKQKLFINIMKENTLIMVITLYIMQYYFI
jgi:hypothetical protein